MRTPPKPLPLPQSVSGTIPRVPPPPTRASKFPSTEADTGKTNLRVVTYSDVIRVFERVEEEPGRQLELVELNEGFVELTEEDRALVLRIIERLNR